MSLNRYGVETKMYFEKDKEYLTFGPSLDMEAVTPSQI
jgi:hypothetical protein